MESKSDLGKAISSHGISQAYLQRALFISVLSLVFFLAMMVGFYIRQHIGYFLLASAFLLIYLVMLFSWMIQRKTRLTIFENGFTYKKTRVLWNEIQAIDESGEILTTKGRKIALPRSIEDFGIVLTIVRDRTSPG